MPFVNGRYYNNRSEILSLIFKLNGMPSLPRLPGAVDKEENRRIQNLNRELNEAMEARKELMKEYERDYRDYPETEKL